MKLQLRYFASIRESLGLEQEAIELPVSVRTMDDLRAHLRLRGGIWTEVLGEGRYCAAPSITRWLILRRNWWMVPKWLFSHRLRAAKMTIRIQQADFDLTTEIANLRKGDLQVGAITSFVGTVRDMNEGSTVNAMTLEHYPGMTEKALEDILNQAKARWDIRDALVIHRIGPLMPADQIVLVAVTSAHRGESFLACEFIMDYLKTAAPFWKKEDTPEGGRWVDARVTDDAAATRWNQKKPAS
jgi:molybdopterin synthase catalytic subunit